MDSTAYSLERTNNWKKNFVVAANHKADKGWWDLGQERIKNDGLLSMLKSRTTGQVLISLK